MYGDSIHPTTLVGIKRLAKQIGSRESVQHRRALDLASQAARYQNYDHARAQLGSGGSQLLRGAKHVVYLTAYWRDPKTYVAGRETLAVSLSSPWQDIFAVRDLLRRRYLGSFKRSSDDHLIGRMVFRDSHGARGALCGAAREFQFAETTGLRPASRNRSRYLDPRDELPGADHSSLWVYPQTGHTLIVDEPYAPAVPQHAGARSAWAERNGYRIEEAEWPGMYAPELGSVMFLVAHLEATSVLTRCLQALENADAPIVEESWSGESGGYRPAYRSPGEVQSGARARATPDPLYCRDIPSTKMYAFTSSGPRRRPDARMPIEVHEVIGRIIKGAIARTRNRAGVCSRLDTVRGRLDSWLQREYSGDELDNERCFDVYYHGEERELSSPDFAGEQIAELAKAEALLKRYYPDCRPLRELLKSLHGAIKSLEALRQRQGSRAAKRRYQPSAASRVRRT